MARSVVFSEGEYYHVFNRGTEKRDIFQDAQDKERFLKILYACNGTEELDLRRVPNGMSVFDLPVGERLVHIGAFCLMDNHFHLLLREYKVGGLSAFMQKIGTAHTKFFNRKYERTGHLFESTFKAVHAESDNHLRHLFAYIHLNAKDIIPLRRFGEYPFSSFLDYCGESRKEANILTRCEFPGYYTDRKEFLGHLRDWYDEDYAEAKLPQ